MSGGRSAAATSASATPTTGTAKRMDWPLNFYWSSVRGPYASVRLPGGFRVGYKI
jgi:hypothetical protein